MIKNDLWGYNEERKELFNCEDLSSDPSIIDSTFEYLQLLFKIKGINNAKVLDAGGGMGRLSKYFNEHGISCVSLDARQLRTLAGANQVQADAYQMPFPDQTFDVINDTGCLDPYIYEHDFPKLFAEIHRVLKPGGILLSNNLSLIMRLQEESGLTKYFFSIDLVSAERRQLSLADSPRIQEVYERIDDLFKRVIADLDEADKSWQEFKNNNPVTEINDFEYFGTKAGKLLVEKLLHLVVNATSDLRSFQSVLAIFENSIEEISRKEGLDYQVSKSVMHKNALMDNLEEDSRNCLQKAHLLISAISSYNKTDDESRKEFIGEILKSDPVFGDDNYLNYMRSLVSHFSEIISQYRAHIKYYQNKFYQQIGMDEVAEDKQIGLTKAAEIVGRARTLAEGYDSKIDSDINIRNKAVRGKKLSTEEEKMIIAINKGARSSLISQEMEAMGGTDGIKLKIYYDADLEKVLYNENEIIELFYYAVSSHHKAVAETVFDQNLYANDFKVEISLRNVQYEGGKFVLLEVFNNGDNIDLRAIQKRLLGLEADIADHLPKELKTIISALQQKSRQIDLDQLNPLDTLFIHGLNSLENRLVGREAIDKLSHGCVWLSNIYGDALVESSVSTNILLPIGQGGGDKSDLERLINIARQLKELMQSGEYVVPRLERAAA